MLVLREMEEVGGVLERPAALHRFVLDREQFLYIVKMNRPADQRQEVIKFHVPLELRQVSRSQVPNMHAPPENAKNSCTACANGIPFCRSSSVSPTTSRVR